MLPWFTYNYVTLGRFTLSPAGGVGRGLWEGSWQATMVGPRAGPADRSRRRDRPTAPTLDRARRARRRPRAARRRADARLRASVAGHPAHLGRSRSIRTSARVARVARRSASISASRSRTSAAIVRAHLARRLARGVFVLWAGDIPFRYSEINALPPCVIRADAGRCRPLLVRCWRIVRRSSLLRAERPHRRRAALLAAPIVYITAVHFPLLTEARQSLPAQAASCCSLAAHRRVRGLEPADDSLRPRTAGS